MRSRLILSLLLFSVSAVAGPCADFVAGLTTIALDAHDREVLLRGLETHLGHRAVRRLREHERAWFLSDRTAMAALEEFSSRAEQLATAEMGMLRRYSWYLWGGTFVINSAIVGISRAVGADPTLTMFYAGTGFVFATGIQAIVSGVRWGEGIHRARHRALLRRIRGTKPAPFGLRTHEAKLEVDVVYLPIEGKPPVALVFSSELTK